MIFQLLLVGANANVFDPLESHRSIVCRLDSEYDNRFVIGDELNNFKINRRLKLCSKPVFQFLVADLFLIRLEFCPDYPMGLVLNAEYQIGILPVVQSGRIGKGRDIFTNSLGLSVTNLEFQPFGFTRLGTKPIQKGMQFCCIHWLSPFGAHGA